MCTQISALYQWLMISCFLKILTLLFTEYADMLVSRAGGKGLSDRGPLNCRWLLVVSFLLLLNCF